MSNKVKHIDIKNRTFYLFNDIVYIENFDSNNIKIDEKYILVDCTGYLTIKDSKYVKIYSLNTLYLIFRNANGYFEEVNKSSI